MDPLANDWAYDDEDKLEQLDHQVCAALTAAAAEGRATVDMKSLESSGGMPYDRSTYVFALEPPYRSGTQTNTSDGTVRPIRCYGTGSEIRSFGFNPKLREEKAPERNAN